MRLQSCGEYLKSIKNGFNMNCQRETLDSVLTPTWCFLPNMNKFLFFCRRLSLEMKKEFNKIIQSLETINESAETSAEKLTIFKGTIALYLTGYKICTVLGITEGHPFLQVGGTHRTD